MWKKSKLLAVKKGRRPYRVFISHNSRDFGPVEQLRDDLRRLEIEAYVHEADPRPGTLIREKVLGEIRRSDAMVVLLTKSAAASAYVQQEVGAGLSQRKAIVPIVELDVERLQLAMLEGMECVNWDSKDPAKALSAVVDVFARRKAEHTDQQSRQNERNAIAIALGGLVTIMAASSMR